MEIEFLCRAHSRSFNTHKSSALSAQNDEQKKIMMMMKTEKETIYRENTTHVWGLNLEYFYF